jgi:hypothetical protein
VGNVRLLAFGLLMHALFVPLCAVDAQDSFADMHAFSLSRVPDSRDCYTYTTSKGDTLEWLCGRLGLKLATVVADNRDVLTSGINKLNTDMDIKLCDIPAGAKPRCY